MTIFGANETMQPGPDARRLGWIRLAIGIVQGIALYLLYLSKEAGVWPSTLEHVSNPLVLVTLFIPIVLLGGTGRFRLRTLAVWILVATIAVGAMGWWSGASYLGRNGAEPYVAFGALAALATPAFLFILHHLILAADITRRRIAPYPVYFDTAWKAGVQLALSGAFTGAFWLLLLLGSGLFSMIGLDFLRTLIGQEWFSIPATTLAFAAAVHLTDVKDGLIRGVRTVALMLLSWLLPVMAILTAGFIAALPFAGVGRLWEAGYGTNLMLAAAAALIILVNAGYQDGEPDGRPHAILQWTARLAAVLLVPLMGLALWGMALRIGQHGLTPERIIALTLVLLGVIYAGGYAFAAVRPGPWMRPLERTNVIAALATVAAILALFTPIADPLRLSVSDQMRRLETGRVSAQDFDYAFLRFDAGRAGKAALDSLVASDDPEIARRAAEARNAVDRYTFDHLSTHSGLQIEVLPGSPPLPENFLQDADGLLDGQIPYDRRRTCRNEDDCLAAARDLDGDGAVEWLMANASHVAVYGQADNGWREIGSYEINACGHMTQDAQRQDARELLRGGLTFAPSPLPDLTLGDTRIPLTRRPDCRGEVPTLDELEAELEP